MSKHELSSEILAARPANDNKTLIAGRYHVEQLLGEGGMAAVYAVRDGATGKRIALKQLFQHLAPGAGVLFEREYRTLAGLRHPGIVEVYEYGVDQNGAYYTMELLEGQELANLAPMPWRAVCACLRDTASILGLLHARGLVHRDLSPRNLFRLPDGGIKLLDFGALAPFGEATEIVGTPPFIPPEALNRMALDQRSDLYSLGALGYWLVSGVHAFPAKSLADLPRLWQRESPRLAAVFKLLKGGEDSVPQEFESLLLALLRLEPNERPSDTAAVVDRLNSLAELDRKAGDTAVQGFLDSKVFVGRVRERERLEQVLSVASGGTTQVVFVEGAEGIGRTRLLEELATMARISGALVLTVSGADRDQPYGVACALAAALLKSLPEEAKRAAAPHAPILGHLSREIHQALGSAQLAAMVRDAREDRLRKQAALTDWFCSVSRERPLAMLVDDLHTVDDGSQAVLAALARAGQGNRLFVTVTASSGARVPLSPAAQSMRRGATRIRLLPLSAAETRRMLQSVFGDAPYLERLAERLHKMSEGNPRYCLELAQHLVHSGSARYADGMWALPTELASEDLPSNLQASLLARLDRLPPEVRALARLLSVPDHGSLSRELCLSVSGITEGETHAGLTRLVREQILRKAETGFRFVHTALREKLYAELEVPERVRVHRAFGTFIAGQAESDHLLQLRASLHFLRAGELNRGEALLFKGGTPFLEVRVESVGAAAPMFEEALALLDAAGRDKYSLVLPLTALTFAGYFADRRYAARHGARAIAVLDDVLKLGLARKLRGFLGAKLALLVALFVAGLALRGAKDRTPDLKGTVGCLLGSAVALAGVSAISVDPKAVWRHAAVIEPLTTLGKHHAATFLHRFCGALALGIEDRQGKAEQTLRSLLEWLESDRPMEGMRDFARKDYLAAVRFQIGIRECWKDGPAGLLAAENLEQFGPLYAMYADQLRANYHSGIGDLERSKHFRSCVEAHAVQLGSAWQVETWAPADAMTVAVWTNDALALKRAAEELLWLSAELPSLAGHERRLRGAYYVVRGKYHQALELLTDADEPLSVIGWKTARAMAARAHRGLGQYARAREICDDALGRLKPEDMSSIANTLDLQKELALADAGLGNFDEANRRLDDLIAHHTPYEGPLVLGVLHQARARVALAQKDLATAEMHLQKMERWVRPTKIPPLLEVLGNLKQELERARNPEHAGSNQFPLNDAERLVSHVQLLMNRTGKLITERATQALQIALELTSADQGFVVLLREPCLAACLGSESDKPDAALVAWAKERLLAAYADDETARVDQADSVIDLNLKVIGELRYCLTPLWAIRDRKDVPVAVLALGFERGKPQLPESEVLRVIASHLDESSPEVDAQTTVA